MTTPSESPGSLPVERYLPGIVLERLVAEPGARQSARSESLSGAILFADIAGFTAVTERLAKDGPVGAERLAGLLNQYFGKFMAAVLDAGGDVLKLAGDSALVVWRRAPEEPLAACVRRATRTALQLQRVLTTVAAPSVEGDVTLATRIAVCAGELAVLHVGGVYDRWEVVVAGPALRQIAVCADAAPGQVVLSAEAAACLAGSVSGEATGAGVRVDELPDPATGPASGVLRSVGLGRDVAASLQSYVPGAVRARVDAGQSDWLAELRTVSVLFIGLHGATDASASDLAALDAEVRALQIALYRYEGSLNKISVDDKGITALAVMGLPPFAHEDDAARAVYAARRIRVDLAALGVRSSVGIAHGRVFCGVVGNERRCEYTVLGDVVNLAARLMQAAGDEILCDAATADSARARFRFDALRPILVKGKAQPIAVHTPIEPRAALPARRPIIGRTDELARVDARLQKLGSGEGGVLLLEGDAGIGKSRLAAEAAERARALGFGVFTGHADATERSSAYHAWRPVFADLLGLEPEVPTSLERVRATVGAEHDGRLPLLNEVLALGLPDNELTAEMRGQVRADNTRGLLVDLLEAAAARGPLALVLEDTHWTDSASLGLVHLCSRRLPSVLFVLTTRPVAEESQEPELRQILGDPATERLRLAPLAGDEVSSLVCRRLGASKLSDAVTELIRGRAQGNPFFSEELAHGLLDAGVVVVADGEARISAGVDLETVALPESVDAVITSRVDRLSPDEQLTLKVASVIGRVFELALLRDVYPMAEREALAGVLARLEQRELITRDDSAHEDAYLFRHALIVEAVYAQMLFAQRQKLHHAVAERLERASEGLGATPPWGRLAHHWSRAGDEGRALPCFEQAGAQALRSGAYLESTSFLGEALRRCPRGSSPAERLRAGRLERELGEAEFGLGKLDAASEQLERALETLGGRAPWSLGVPARVLAGLATQVAHRLLPGTSRDGPREESFVEQARAWSLLTFVYYFLGDATKLVGAALQFVNAAEKAGPSPELAIAYSGLAVPAGLIGLDRVADSYLERARSMAKRVDDEVATAFVHVWIGTHWIGRGEWRRARDEVAPALHIYDTLGDRRRWTEITCALSTVAHYEGRFHERLELGAEVSARGKHTRDVQSQAWGMLDRAESLLPLGREREAAELLEVVLGLVDAIPRTDQLWAHGLAALAFLRLGDRARARTQAGEARRLMKVVPPTAFYVMEGYAGATETFLALGEEPSAWAGALECLGILRRYAFALPIALPRHRLLSGLAEWHRGRRKAAHQAWRKAAAAADRLAMPYEAARARLETALHLEALDPARRPALQAALDAFERLHAAGDARRAREALEQK
ncbi:MAG: AAA family ATPase [Myxococcales bacterium]|nr:AAA family ATPase [Myxococcales bacterium]